MSFRQPRAEGSGFAVSTSSMERDPEAARDADMGDQSSIRTHWFSSGQYSSVVGTHTIGTSACNVTLDYVVTVRYPAPHRRARAAGRNAGRAS